MSDWSRLVAISTRTSATPSNAAFDYSPSASCQLINNAGDPFVPSNIRRIPTTSAAKSSTPYERHAPADSTWGYVTNGGTEGNMYGSFS